LNEKIFFIEKFLTFDLKFIFLGEINSSDLRENTKNIFDPFGKLKNLFQLVYRMNLHRKFFEGDCFPFNRSFRIFQKEHFEFFG